jgi:hypothetical protein
MSWEQYFAGYPYFTPYVGPELARRFFGDVAEKTYDDNVPGFERHLDIPPSVPEIKGTGEDSYLRAAITLMLRNWDKQLALIPLTAYRGMFVGGCCTTLSNDVPAYWAPPKINTFLNERIRPVHQGVTMLLGPAAFLLAGIMFARRNWTFFLFSAPVIFHFTIHAVATHFNPRFSVPVYPSLIVMLIVLACVLVTRYQPRDRSPRETRA